MTIPLALSLPSGMEAMALYGLYFIPILVLHILFASGVFRDAFALKQTNGGLFLFGPFVWSFVALFFGLLGVVAYWAIHHSALKATQLPVRRH